MGSEVQHVENLMDDSIQIGCQVVVDNQLVDNIRFDSNQSRLQLGGRVVVGLQLVDDNQNWVGSRVRVGCRMGIHMDSHLGSELGSHVGSELGSHMGSELGGN